MLRRSSLVLLTSAVALVAGANRCDAALIQWTGSAGDYNWNNPANWNLGRVPNIADDAFCSQPPAAGEIHVSTNAACNTLTSNQRIVVAGGYLIVNTAATLNGGLLMYNPNGNYSVLENRGTMTAYGTMSLFQGSIRQKPGATFEFGSVSSTTIFNPSAANGMSFEGGGFTNNGYIEVQAPSFYVGNYNANDPLTVFSNSPSGLMRFNAATAIHDHGVNGGATILLNQGNLQFTQAGASSLDPKVELWNNAAGFVDVGPGSLSIAKCTNVGADSKLNGASWYVHDGGSISFGTTLLGIAANTDVYVYNAGSNIAGLATATDIRGNLYINDGGSVTIAQTIYGSLTNRGLIFIGASGQLITTGSYIQYPEGTLRRAIDSAAALSTPGIIAGDRPILNGTLIVDFYDTNLIQPGNEFPIVAGTCCTTGGFDSVTVLPDNGYTTNMDYANGDAALRVPAPCLGDFNDDGSINTLDLTLLLGHFGQAVVAGSAGDINSDGVVNTNDLVDFLFRFGTNCG